MEGKPASKQSYFPSTGRQLQAISGVVQASQMKNDSGLTQRSCSPCLPPNRVIPKPFQWRGSLSIIKASQERSPPLLLACPFLLIPGAGVENRRQKGPEARLLSDGCCVQTRHPTLKETDGAAVSMHAPGHQESSEATQ